jgi:hypothetical protein
MTDKNKKTAGSEMKPDFRAPTASKRIPRAVADGGGGTISCC